MTFLDPLFILSFLLLTAQSEQLVENDTSRCGLDIVGVYNYGAQNDWFEAQHLKMNVFM